MDGLRSIWHRVYSDFLMPPRFEMYKNLITEILNLGYEIHSVSSFWQILKAGNLRPDVKYVVLRHDVDTDPAAAEAQWQIEKSLGVKASYYFRLSTLNISLMREMAQAGFEVGYHYEEIATVAKEKCLKSRKQIQQNMPYIRQRFKENLSLLRKRTGLPMKIVASHGDFVNRALKTPNYELLNRALRQEMEIELEVYDEIFNQYVTSRHIDCAYPKFWRPSTPYEAIYRAEHVVYIITHPRHWRVNRNKNLIDDVKRLWEGLRYHFCKGQ